MERLQKVIANSGYCSRRKAEELISLGKVKVNGTTIREMGYKASYTDYIEVEGNPIEQMEDKVYYLLNKPRGVITASSDDKGRKTEEIIPMDIKELKPYAEQPFKVLFDSSMDELLVYSDKIGLFEAFGYAERERP